jgi:predicted phosphodiesterase
MTRNQPLNQDPARLLVCGDTHGRISSIERAIEACIGESCDAIVQVGDFGFFPIGGEEFLLESSRLLREARLSLVFIDGNHEDHDSISRLDANRRGILGCIDSGYEKIEYAPRGYVSVWTNRRVLWCGGAASTDRAWRLVAQKDSSVATHWWSGETINDADVETACSAESVDVLFSHDMPVEVMPAGLELMIDVETTKNRLKISSITRATTPSLVFHGHYHHRHSSSVQLENEKISVEGLACEGSNDEMFCVLDLQSLMVERFRRFNFA